MSYLRSPNGYCSLLRFSKIDHSRALSIIISYMKDNPLILLSGDQIRVEIFSHLEYCVLT